MGPQGNGNGLGRPVPRIAVHFLHDAVAFGEGSPFRGTLANYAAPEQTDGNRHRRQTLSRYLRDRHPPSPPEKILSNFSSKQSSFWNYGAARPRHCGRTATGATNGNPCR